MLNAAVLTGDSKLVWWMRSYKCPWNATTCNAAAQGTVNDTTQQKTTTTTATIANSTKYMDLTYLGGHLTLFWELRSRGCPCSMPSAVGAAAKGGQLGFLKSMLEDGIKVSSEDIIAHAVAGNIRSQSTECKKIPGACR